MNQNHERYIDWYNSLEEKDQKIAHILWDDTGRPRHQPGDMFEVVLNNCETKVEWKRRFDLFFDPNGISIGGDELSDVLWDIYIAGMRRTGR